MGEPEGCRVYAGNLSFNTDQDRLTDEFSKFGGIVDCKLITDRETGRSRGFGFITFDCQESANGAVQGGPLEIDGRDVKISIAQARNDSRGGGGGGRGGGRGGGYRGSGGYNQGQQRSYGGDRSYGGGGNSYGGSGGYGGGDQGYGHQGGGGGGGGW